MQVCPNCGSENPARFRLCGFCGTALPASEPAELATPDERKTVTIVFSDLVGSTSLGERIDPEVMSGLLNRYFEVMTAILERHGGAIQKFIGDAIVAVFGIPQVHEDDALRAVRAAHEMQLTLARLNEELERTYGTPIEARIGVKTGEIVVGDAVTGQQVVTGDTANVAARLEQAAPAMGVYVGGTTYRLVRDAVEVEKVEPLELKGKAEPVPAFRLLSVHGTDEGVARRFDTPLVGRESELEALQAAYRRAVDGQRCHAITLIGDAGVGKSRLIREFVARIGDEPRVIRGRVLSYGEGITFWPLAELVRDAAGIDIDAPAQAALDNLGALVGDQDVVDRLASAIGLSDQQLPISELTWGARRFFETLAGDRPVVAVIDDIHWAEPAFLDLLEHLTDYLEGAQVLLVATARHELLETRPTWGQTACTSLVMLEALTDDQAVAVVSNLLGGAGLPTALLDRIVGASGGNPLFVEQMLSMLVDDGVIHPMDGSWQVAGQVADFPVPPTIQALLSARLDRLNREEHAILDPAAVIGVEFPTPAVTDLSPPTIRDRVGSLLESMTTKQLVRPTGSVVVGYRFSHQLIRDTAYQSMLKRGRAKLHELFADWLTAHESDRLGEVEEVIGYHLEQAHGYLLGLGPLDDHGRELGRRAADLLDLSGRRAVAREDMHAAVGLIRRSVDLRPTDSPELRASQLVLAEALDEIGVFGEAATVLEAVERAAEAARDAPAGAKARLLRIRLELGSDPRPDWNSRALAEADQAIPVFEAAHDASGACLAWRLRYLAHGTTGLLGEAAEDAEQVIRLAAMAGDERQRLRGMSNLAVALTHGPTPAAEAADRLAALSSEVGADRWTGIALKAATALLLAMQRQFERAQTMVEEAREAARGLGQPMLVAQLSLQAAEVDLRAGAPDRAESALRDATTFFENAGETFILASVASLLGRALVEQGRLSEATAQADRAASLAAEDDFDAQARCRGLRSAILLAEGDYPGAVARAEEALSMARSAEMPMVTAMAMTDLAAALMAAGDEARAGGVRDEARALYAAKGDLASADRLILSPAR
jgi:class 3 adenylate cyclase/tetratricopeptide (TPR) repeat protein